jgi:formate dehydrogenase subunit gamma
MNKVLSIALLLALFGGSVQAQTQAASGSVAPAPAPVPALAAGVQSQNIMDVKPDASADPGYAKQTNGERDKVQPGNNAPMWRQVGAGATGYSSLPTPEAGNLIQPFVQYPGSRLTNAVMPGVRCATTGSFPTAARCC